MTQTNIQAFFDFVVQLATASTPIVLAYIAYKQILMTRDVKLLEKNTNSMKDALVAVTKESALAKGNLEGRAELMIEQAIPPAVSADPQTEE